jgi:hypothetical protein|tara:strand:+ start:520 stop:1137 length:618 start_codon:yes stop_codon:yes gene_type:complete
MSIITGPRIVTSGLRLSLDALDPESYAGSGNDWLDRSGNGFNFTNEAGFTSDFDARGWFDLDDYGTDGATSTTISAGSTSTLVFWIKTTETQALFWQGQSNSYFVGAYKSSNKEYYGNAGSPTFWMDAVEKDNIYDYIRDGEWHMVEFKSVDLSSWTRGRFSNYSSFTFGNGAIAKILIYDRNLTTAESKQNFNAIRGRFDLPKV